MSELTGVKKWYTSKTVWADIVIAVVSVLTAIDKQYGMGIMTSPITQVVLTILAALGVYGRVTAKDKIE